MNDIPKSRPVEMSIRYFPFRSRADQQFEVELCWQTVDPWEGKPVLFTKFFCLANEAEALRLAAYLRRKIINYEKAIPGLTESPEPKDKGNG